MASFGLVLPLLVLVAGCHCAPKIYGAGGRLGFESQFGATLGGYVQGKPDGASISGGGTGRAGFSYKPRVVAEGFLQNDDKFYSADASLGADITRDYQVDFKGGLGRNSEGNLLLGIVPTVTRKSRTSFIPLFHAYTEDDAKRHTYRMQYEATSNYFYPQNQPAPYYGYPSDYLQRPIAERATSY